MTSTGRQPGPESHRNELEALWALRRIIQALDVHSRRLVATADVTLTQLICLLTIVAAGPLMAREISRRIHVGTSTLVGVLDRLEAKGLIERARDTHDRRRVLVAATIEGRELVERAPSPFGESFEEGWNELTGAEQGRLAASLGRIADLIQPPSASATGLSTKVASENVKS